MPLDHDVEASKNLRSAASICFLVATEPLRLHCPPCGGRRELIALITQPHTAQRILEALGLTAEPPGLAPARPPPQSRLPFVG